MQVDSRAAAQRDHRPAAPRTPDPLHEAAATAACLVGGLVTGIAAKWSDGGWTPSWLHDLGNYPALFVVALVLLAITAPGEVRAATRAVAFFVALCAGYYAASLLGFGFLSRTSLVAWTTVALTVVPIAAVLLRWALRRRGFLPGAAFTAVAGAVLADGTVRQVYWAWTGDIARAYWFLLHPVQAAVDVVLAIVVCLLPRTWRTRLWAFVLLVPMTLLVTRLVGMAYSYGGLG